MQVELILSNYIGHTYCTALAEKVHLEKQMKISPKTGDAKRKVAEEAWLEKMGYDTDHLAKLQSEIDRKAAWGLELDGEKEIVLFGNRLVNALVDTLRNFGKPLKLKLDRSDLRTYIAVSNFRTGKVRPDWTWTRAILGRDIAGKTQATAKRISTNQVIGEIPNWITTDPEQIINIIGDTKPFAAVGEITIDEFAPDGFADDLFTLLDYCGQHVGVGCSRDMGFGRFYRIGGKKHKAAAKPVEAVAVADDEE